MSWSSQSATIIRAGASTSEPRRRSYGRFERSFALPEDVNAAKVSAEFKDGLLKVHVPKDESAKPKAVEVKVS